MKILVTGGAGYIGSILVPELLKLDHEVIAIDNFMYKQNSLLDVCYKDNLTVINGDARNKKLISKHLKNSDFILPMACIVGAPACDRDPIAGKTTNYDAINNKRIYLPDYGEMHWWQKIVTTIFGAFQIIIGTALTIFSGAAYLFSGKHGMFLNMSYDEKISRNPAQPNVTPATFKQWLTQKKQNLKNILPTIFTKQYFAAKSIDDSIQSTQSDKILINSGWTKFSAFVDFLYFIPVDKLTYGTNFFIEKPSSFTDRFKYFWLICFVLLLIGLTRGSFSGGSAAIASLVIVLIILFVFFAGWALNPEKNISPIANYSSLLDKYNKATGLGLKYNEYAETIGGIKEAIEQTMKQHYNL